MAGARPAAGVARAHCEAQTASPTARRLAILIAAEIAEALAVTTYTNIINTAPFFKRLAADDQGYLKAARQEEMSHYLLEKSVTGKPSPFTTFYYPPKMFSDAQTTLNVLVTLEDAFIAAYLVGVRDSAPPTCASPPRGSWASRATTARWRGSSAGGRQKDGGPIEKITGVQGNAESVDPPNNNGYERTLEWTKISQAVAALTPFADKTAAAKAGFDTEQGVHVPAVQADAPERARRVPLVRRLTLRRRGAQAISQQGASLELVEPGEDAGDDLVEALQHPFVVVSWERGVLVLVAVEASGELVEAACGRDLLVVITPEGEQRAREIGDEEVRRQLRIAR